MRDPEGETLEEIPERPISPHRNLVTPEGLAQIEREVARLEGALSAAQQAIGETGDEEDRLNLLRIGRDLRYWMARRSSAELVPPLEESGKVHFGSTVLIEREDGRRQRWRRPSSRSISTVLPKCTLPLSFSGGTSSAEERRAIQ